MNSKGYLASAAKALSLSDKEIAHKLGLSVAALRSLDGPVPPSYLRLALAALVAGLDPDSVLKPASAAAYLHKGRKAVGQERPSDVDRRR